MEPPAGWTVSPTSSRWELLFNYDDLKGQDRWYQLTSEGTVTESLSGGRNRPYCLMSPSGSKALLLGHTSFHEGTYGLWLMTKSVFDLRLGTETENRFAVGLWPAWSHDEARVAYSRPSDRGSRQDDPAVRSLRDLRSVLAIRDLGSGEVHETETGPIEALRWRPDDREVLTIIGDRERLSLKRFATDDLTEADETTLPFESTAEGISISPDLKHISFCDSGSGEDSPSDEPYIGFIHDLTDGQTISIGPQCLYTHPIWSPTGSLLAFRGWKEAGAGECDFLRITDRVGRETFEFAPLNPDDLSGDITGPDPAWSPDGELLAFVSYEERGSVIYIVEPASGTHARVLQTDGLVHSLGFVRTG